MRVLVTFFVTVGLFVGSCKQQISGSESCGDGAGCEQGFVCVDGECRQLCSAESPCPDDEVCAVQGYCRKATEQEPPEIQTIDSDGPVDGVPPYTEHRIGTRLIITGRYLAQATAPLEALNDGMTSFDELTNLSAGDRELIVALPPGLEDETGSLNYMLVVSNPGGSAEVELVFEWGQDATDVTGVDVITLIDTARGGGASLLADKLGSYDEAAIGALEARLVAVEAAATTLEKNAIATANQARWACPGAVRRGVCLVDYQNTGVDWGAAVSSCMGIGTDLCTTAQYAVVREGDAWGTNNFSMFFDNRAVWSADFSDNDGGVKGNWLYSADDPVTTNEYGFGCCQNALAEPFRQRVAVWKPTGFEEASDGVWTTYVHPYKDTTFPTAASVCAKMSSDLCTKSQYVTLHDNGLFGDPPMEIWTNDQSDNDGDLFDAIVGPPIGSSPGWASRYAYACCGDQRPLDGSCPGTMAGNICLVDMDSNHDFTFFEAARICASHGADLCSKSQMHFLRNLTTFPSQAWSWTNDGADNDSTRVGGLNNSQPDDPDPATNLMGYACCY